MCVAVPPLPSMSSWHGALLSTGTTLLYSDRGSVHCVDNLKSYNWFPTLSYVPVLFQNNLYITG